MARQRSFYHPLAIARVRAGFLSQQELADACKISKAAIANIERGKMSSIPNSKVGNGIAIQLGISPDEVIEMVLTGHQMFKKHNTIIGR